MNTITVGPDKPLKETIELVGRYGFEGIEIASDRIDDFLKTGTLDDLAAVLKAAGLDVAAIMAFGLSAFGDAGRTLESVRTNARRVTYLGGSVLLVYIAEEPPAGMSRADAIKAYGAAAREYGKAAAEFGAKVALELIGGHSVVRGPADVLEVADAAGLDNVGIMMDTFHFFKSGVSPDEVRPVPAQRMFIVHVNDCKDLPIEELNDSHRVHCGLGIMPVKEYLRALKTIGYEGYLSVEIFNSDYWADEPETVVRETKSGLDSVLAALPKE